MQLARCIPSFRGCEFTVIHLSEIYHPVLGSIILQLYFNLIQMEGKMRHPRPPACSMGVWTDLGHELAQGAVIIIPPKVKSFLMLLCCCFSVKRCVIYVLPPGQFKTKSTSWQGGKSDYYLHIKRKNLQKKILSPTNPAKFTPYSLMLVVASQ